MNKAELAAALSVNAVNYRQQAAELLAKAEQAEARAAGMSAMLAAITLEGAAEHRKLAAKLLGIAVLYEEGAAEQVQG